MDHGPQRMAFRMVPNARQRVFVVKSANNGGVRVFQQAGNVPRQPIYVTKQHLPEFARQQEYGEYTRPTYHIGALIYVL